MAATSTERIIWLLAGMTEEQRAKVRWYAERIANCSTCRDRFTTMTPPFPCPDCGRLIDVEPQ